MTDVIVLKSMSVRLLERLARLCTSKLNSQRSFLISFQCQNQEKTVWYPDEWEDGIIIRGEYKYIQTETKEIFNESKYMQNKSGKNWSV